jgi:hypothetical protein
MAGALFAENNADSLHSSLFFPFRTPTPVLVIREMVLTDLQFLDPVEFSVNERILFLESFVDRFRGEHSPRAVKAVARASRLRTFYRTGKLAACLAAATVLLAVLILLIR